MNIPNHKIRIEFLIILIVIYYSCFLTQEVWIGKDHAEYLLLARSLAQGGGYVDHFLATPKIDLRYPPGYPFILSLLIRVFGENLLILRISTIIFLGLALFILSKITSIYLRQKENLLVLLLFAFNSYHLIFIAHTINSDCVYFLFSWLGILFFMNDKNTLSTNKILLGTLFIISAFYMRAIGISLYFALIIYLLLYKKYRQIFLVVLPLGLLIIPWLIYILIKQAGYSAELWMKEIYGPSLSTLRFLDIFFRLIFSLKYYAGKVVANLLLFPYFYWETFGSAVFAFKIILSLFFSILFLRGFYLSIREKIRFLDIYALVYFFLILLWPIHSERLLLPIFPFLLGYLFIALREVKAFKIFKYLVILGLFSVIIMANFRLDLAKDLMRRNLLPYKPCIAQSFPWLKDNTPQEAIIMSEDPAGVYLYTQRKGVRFHLGEDPDKSLRKIKAERINYIILRKVSDLTFRGVSIETFDKYIQPLFKKYPHYFNLVYQSRDECGVLIYKIDIPVKDR